MKNKNISTITFVLFCLSNLLSVTHAQEPIYTTKFSNVALNAYDPVSYSQNGKPEKGLKEFSTSWKGAEWHFQSSKNLNLFLESPSKYAPQYGGYCSWATANGRLAQGDPLVYSLIDNKLYLNFNRRVEKRWQEKRSEFIKKADELYPKLVKISR